MRLSGIIYNSGGLGKCWDGEKKRQERADLIETRPKECSHVDEPVKMLWMRGTTLEANITTTKPIAA